MPKSKPSRKKRRFFTTQPLGDLQSELWLDPAETHHLRDSIRLETGDTCLVTDGEGREVEAMVREFTKDGRAHLRIIQGTFSAGRSQKQGIFLRVMPALLRKGKTDIVIEKAQELGVHEIQPIFSEHCEIKIAEEKKAKIVERWQRIAREASKQSGALKIVHIEAPTGFKQAMGAISAGEPVAVFHPVQDAIPFADWLGQIQSLKEKIKRLNIFIGPEGGFSDDEIAWAQWQRKGKQFWIVELGDVLLKADTAFVGIAAALRFSGVLS